MPRVGWCTIKLNAHLEMMSSLSNVLKSPARITDSSPTAHPCMLQYGSVYRSVGRRVSVGDTEHRLRCHVVYGGWWSSMSSVHFLHFHIFAQNDNYNTTVFNAL